MRRIGLGALLASLLFVPLLIGASPIADLFSRVEALEADSETLSGQVATLEVENQTLSTQVEDLEAELESRTRPVLVDSTGQEVGALIDSSRVAIESGGAVLQLHGAARHSWEGVGSTFHLAADCTDEPRLLDDTTDPLTQSNSLYDVSVVSVNRDLFAVDNSSEPVLIWDPTAPGSLPRVYRASRNGCEEDGTIAINQGLPWYLIPLRFVLNLNQAYPPPLHIEVR